MKDLTYAAAFIEDAARRKNGLNFQIFLAGTLVCLSAFPLIAAFLYPILSAKAFALFLLGTAMSYGAWPVFAAGLDARRRLEMELNERHIRYEDVQRAAQAHLPAFARTLFFSEA